MGRLDEVMAALIDAWCERRALEPLRRVLPVFPLAETSPQAWQELREALREVRLMAAELESQERVLLDKAIALADQALYGR